MSTCDIVRRSLARTWGDPVEKLIFRRLLLSYWTSNGQPTKCIHGGAGTTRFRNGNKQVAARDSCILIYNYLWFAVVSITEKWASFVTRWSDGREEGEFTLYANWLSARSVYLSLRRNTDWCCNKEWMLSADRSVDHYTRSKPDFCLSVMAQKKKPAAAIRCSNSVMMHMIQCVSGKKDRSR